MDMKKASETRLEQLLSVKKKLCKEQAFDEIGAEVHMLGGGG